MMTPIAGGEKYEVVLGQKGIPKTEDDKVLIEMAGIMLDSKNTLACFNGRVRFKKPLQVKSILMEDITDDPITPVIFDEHPTILPDGEWIQTSAYKPLTDPAFRWLMLIDNSVRVYRFTIITQDGQTLVYRQADFYNQYIKESIRKAMGLKS